MPPGDPKAKRPCLPETLGLIGFHAVHKTVGRPQWIWTSFEHVKNVPDKEEVAAKKFSGPYNFFNVNCKDDCPEVNATPPRQFWQPDPALKLKFRGRQVQEPDRSRNAADACGQEHEQDFPEHAARHCLGKLHADQHAMAELVQGCTSLHSQRADAPMPQTDFLKQPDMTCSPAPTFMANSTLETYSQGDIPQASSSCIGCHGNAVGFQTGASNPKSSNALLNQSDFTFMLEKAQ